MWRQEQFKMDLQTTSWLSIPNRLYTKDKKNSKNNNENLKLFNNYIIGGSAGILLLKCCMYIVE